MAIQSVYGVIPKVYGKGRAARQVADYMQNMRKELQGQEPDIVPQIDAAIILDRKVCYKMSRDGNFIVQSLQRSPLFCAPSLVKFVPAVARLFCLALPGSFLTMFAHNKGDLCT